MEKVILVVITIIILAIIFAMIYIWIYNRLQKFVVRIKEAESEIDETLRKRHDILVNIEKSIVSNTELKQDNFKDFKPDTMSSFDADRRLTKIKDTFAKIREDYPDELDNEVTRNLFTELKIVEEKSDAAKSYYNKYTTSLNMLIKKFPSNIIARIHKIEERMYFDNKNTNDANILDFKI